MPGVVRQPPPGVGDVDRPAAGGDPPGGLTCGQSGDLSNPEPDLRDRIDYVFTRGLAVRTCRVVGGRPQDRTPSGLWPSDHAAVVAELAS